jgi:hypothetical protein
MVKEFIRWLVMTTVIVSSSVYGGIDPVVEASFDYQDGGGGSCASVNSWVTDNGDATFTYFYQIDSIVSDYKINYFHFNFLNSPMTVSNVSQLNNWGDYTGTIWADWSRLGASGNVYGMGAFFTTGIMAGTNSVILYYCSDLTPVMTSGMLTGFDPTNQSISLTGNVYTPVPEPATVLLLGMGAGSVIRSKRTRKFFYRRF